jgi:aspartyl-tRNA(Asn)/glutamyl-tRNA(Gln) amidotransferase subunit B
MSDKKYTAVIGLEVHVELKTETKIFCSCKTTFGAEPNTNICPVCLGMPGALPVLGAKQVELAVRAGIAFGCRINHRSWFDRKNYFYPDLPKGYQITQYEKPICEGGAVPITVNGEKKEIRIHHIHMEEDAGKLTHREDGTFVDYNRAGVPLIEIVGEPDIRTSEEAKAYLTSIRRILSYIDVSDCKMNEGSLRCDVNVSVMPEGSTSYGVKCEIKNVNSINYVGKAIDDEIARQSALLESGLTVAPETRRFNEDTGKCEKMRDKEKSVDYRYFTEPNIPPIALTDEYIDNVRKSIPHLPDDVAVELTKYGMNGDDAYLVTSSRANTDYFIKAASLTEYKKETANLFVSEILPLLSDNGEEYIPAEALAEIAELYGSGKIVSGSAKRLIHLVREFKMSPTVLAEREHMLKITDVSVLSEYVETALKENAKAVSDYKKGKKNALKTVLGYVMKISHGTADPIITERIITEKIDEQN